MNRRNFIHGSSFAGAAAMLFPVSTLAQVTVPALPPAGADGWISLLNGHDLSGWYSMIAKGGKGGRREEKDGGDGGGDASHYG